VPLRLQIERGMARLEGVGLRPRLERRVAAMLVLLQLEKAELSLVLSGDARIQELNKVYRGKDKPTDVLAFPMREGDFGRFHAAHPAHLLGDVIVSVPTAVRQARAAKRDALGEITMLVAHGLLHLLGWDHETAAKDKKMRAETDRLVVAAEAVDSPGARTARRGSANANANATKRPRASAKKAKKAKKRTSRTRAS
jgi:probable rRNA maturation factor